MSKQKTHVIRRALSTLLDVARPSQLPENKARKVVLRSLLIVTTFLLGLFFILLVLSYTIAMNHHVLARLHYAALALIIVSIADVACMKQRYTLAASILVGLYGGIAVVSVLAWGINVPFALLFMSITVTLAGIVLGPRFAMGSAVLLCVGMLVAELLNSFGIYTPNTAWQVGAQPKLGEALGYSFLILVLAFVSWLFGKQINQSLRQAQRAEKALQKEKDMLAIRLQKRTEELQAAQLQEMRQLHKFAELGQLSTAFIHDVANQLSVLSLDIENLRKDQDGPVERAVDSAYQSLTYLESMTKEIQVQLRTEEKPRTIDVLDGLHEVAATLQRRFSKVKAELRIESSGNRKLMKIYGGPTRFAQVMTMLISNALEATVEAKSKEDKRIVTVQVDATKQAVTIAISDWGVGIPAEKAEKIFEPFQSTKKDGMGIGLFLTKSLIETHFKGSIYLVNPAKPTMFTVMIPNQVPSNAK